MLWQVNATVLSTTSFVQREKSNLLLQLKRPCQGSLGCFLARRSPVAAGQGIAEACLLSWCTDYEGGDRTPGRSGEVPKFDNSGEVLLELHHWDPALYG